jgi:hypothetical protein
MVMAQVTGISAYRKASRHFREVALSLVTESTSDLTGRFCACLCRDRYKLSALLQKLTF